MSTICISRNNNLICPYCFRCGIRIICNSQSCCLIPGNVSNIILFWCAGGLFCECKDNCFTRICYNIVSGYYLYINAGLSIRYNNTTFFSIECYCGDGILYCANSFNVVVNVLCRGARDGKEYCDIAVGVGIAGYGKSSRGSSCFRGSSCGSDADLRDRYCFV